MGESGTGTGIRRIEAVTGKAAHERAVADAVLLQETATLLKSKEEDIPAKIEQLLTALKEAEREVAQLSHKLATSSLDDILAAKEEIHGVSVTAASVTADSAEGLRDMADMVLDKVGGIVLLGAVQGDKVSFVCKVDKELTKQGYHAGKIVKAAAVAAGGGGGGRPDMAQAGGKDPQNWKKRSRPVKRRYKAQVNRTAKLLEGRVGKMSVNDKTMIVSSKDDQSVASMILEDVYNSLKEKGYNPISQMAGYLLSGDPTYITSHNNARSNIRRLERDELVEELLSSYVKHRNL